MSQDRNNGFANGKLNGSPKEKTTDLTVYGHARGVSYRDILSFLQDQPSSAKEDIIQGLTDGYFRNESEMHTTYKGQLLRLIEHLNEVALSQKLQNIPTEEPEVDGSEYKEEPFRFSKDGYPIEGRVSKELRQMEHREEKEGDKWELDLLRI